MSVIWLVLPPNLHITDVLRVFKVSAKLPPLNQMFIRRDRKRSKNTSIKVHIHKPAGNIIENLMYYTQKKGTKQSLGQYPKVKKLKGTSLYLIMVHILIP